jgi:hypothetical protein
MFDQASLYSNSYMMVMIDTKSKYAWYYYLKTKDEAYDKICELVELKLRDYFVQPPRGSSL